MNGVLERRNPMSPIRTITPTLEDLCHALLIERGLIQLDLQITPSGLLFGEHLIMQSLTRQITYNVDRAMRQIGHVHAVYFCLMDWAREQRKAIQ